MSWIVIVSGAFIVLYGLGIYFWNTRINWRLNDGFSKWIKYLHYTLGTLTVTLILLMIIDDISLSGRWTTRIILVAFLLSGVIIYPLSDWTKKSQVEKIYFRVFSFLPMPIAGFSMIPFLGVIVLASLFGRLTEPVKDIYYEDSNLRIQATFIGVLGPPRLDIFRKDGMFEKRVSELYRSAADIDSVRVEGTSHETFVLIYSTRYEQDDEIDADTIRFRTVE